MRRRRRITHARLLEILRYDSETGEFRWIERVSRSIRIGAVAGTDSEGYRRIMINGRAYRAHQLAWSYMTGKWCTVVIDHRDGNPSNNRSENLRPATVSQNNANRRPNHNNKSGFKGVAQHRIGCWCARIKKNGRGYHLGSFATPQEAHAAYVEAARKLFGEFARAE